MEHLNKYQMTLLVILISFVTSIATGIMTVSLLQQAPVEVIRSINNVVEKTIQSVTPASISSVITPAPTQTTTLVVKEEDLILSSINKNLKSIVRINETDSVGLKSFYGIGVVISKDGIIGTDRQTINQDSIYFAMMSDGAEFKIVPMGVDKNTSSVFFKVNLPVGTKYDFSPASISVSDLQLGQTVIGLGGDTQNTVSVGRVTSLNIKDTSVGTTTTKYISSISSDVSPKDLQVGSPFFDLSGNLVGMQLSENSLGIFYPISLLTKDLNLIQQK